ncbi:ATP-dependent RecD-like DNA helicase [Pleurocapsa sp. PCC 7319]|uniref:ATP-dependent DNA helicase n=1 Tax=Pleurocapsa sp. PCC 7319 TaxID=118161 RepID=UPI000348DB3C|nr:AAA family ATPase [Pleurocapsa sp. PCC 7319]
MAKSYPQNVAIQKLTTTQQQALVKLKLFIQSDQRLFRLSGYAGTGKSFLICHLMEWLSDENFQFVAAAPTNKAAKNLQQVALSTGISIDVKTIAQLLGQQPEINQETGLEEFTSTREAKFDDYEVVIIDEFSMISQGNFEEIVEAVSLTIDTKVVFVGDEAQLPPVKEKKPIVAVSEYIDSMATLDEIVRYEGEIAVVAEKIRSNKQYNRRIYPFKSSDDQTIICQPRKQWLETVTQYFESDNYKSNPDHVRLLVWRNKTALAANKFVRSRLWGKDVPLYVPGDRLIAKKPLFRPRPGKKGKNKWGVLISNSEECSVIDTASIKQLVFDREAYQYWSVPVNTDSGFEVDLSILTEESEQLKNEQAKYYVDKKQWNRYFDLSRMFDDVTYAYGLTVHKAQGSSIDYVFLDTEDMQNCPDLQKMLYTALTRAKIRAFIPSS